ncbi:MAG: hypothetical protein CVT48_00985 [Thermoplasmata archaeon HGW-Thermoplasmata-1]|nr:MAG: hypothetical protein CVT48_00985 [Thermoplasmata archaeon HGW-Thermoplasmata-1]
MNLLHLILGISISLLSGWLLYTSVAAYRKQGSLRLFFIACAILLLLIFGLTLVLESFAVAISTGTLLNMLSLYVLGVLAFMALAIGRV